jgi:hypothetical protein
MLQKRKKRRQRRAHTRTHLYMYTHTYMIHRDSETHMRKDNEMHSRRYHSCLSCAIPSASLPTFMLTFRARRSTGFNKKEN